MAIDTHMHINNRVLSNPQEAIEKVNGDENLECAINIGLDIDTSRQSIAISNMNPKFYSAIGVHPLYIEGQDLTLLCALSDSVDDNQKIIAIGEIGLDDTGKDYDKQRDYFIRQIGIANDLHLPIVIHSNNMNSAIIEIFKNNAKPKYGCVFHCFQPDFDALNYLVDNGFYISFAGRITYKTAHKSHEIARMVPNELFLVETDSPYMTPEPFRGQPNHSSYIRFIIKKISEIKDMSYEEIEVITTENAKRLFKRMK